MGEADILLATYNGERYLPDLLASLDAQTDQNWRIIVRDDGSTDGTVALIRRWGEKLGDRFQLLEDAHGNLGASGNFSALLAASTSPYFLPCDQDDVWLPEKVERLKTAVAAEEASAGTNCPIIVHTDLIVVDEDLNTIAESFWSYQRLRMMPDKEPWKLVTLQNNVTGCAMIGNRALLLGAGPVPETAIMHDWWLALYAALRGRVVEISKPSIRYRQHSQNTLGAQKWSAFAVVKLVLSQPFKALREPRRVIAATQMQARSMLETHGESLPVDQRTFLCLYSDMPRSNLFRRKLFPLRHRLAYRGLIRNVALYLAI